MPRRGITVEELLIVLAMSVSGLIWGADQLAMSLYLHSLGLAPLEVGALLTGMMLFGSFMGLLISALADAYGRKPFVMLGRAVSALAFLALYMGVPYGALLVMGLGGGSLGALLAEKATDLDRDFSLSSALSTAFSAAGASVPWALGLRGTMAFNMSVALVTLALLAPVKEAYRGSGRVTLRLRSIRSLSKLSTQALIGLGAGLLLPMLSLWFYLRFGVGAAQLSPVYMASNATLAAGVLLAPRLGHRMGRVRAIVYTHAAGIALLLALPLSPAFPVASVIFVARNLLMNMANPLFSSLVMALVPSDERARGMSLINLLDAVPRAIGPSFTGYFFGAGYLDVPFFVTAALYSAATYLFYEFFKGAG